MTARLEPGEAGFGRDVAAIAGRAIRGVAREPETWVPLLVIPVFFLAVNVGALQDVAARISPGLDFKGFQLPVAIVFAVTGMSRAPALVTDIQDGYFDRLTITPVSRAALLLGLMAADLVALIGLTVPVLALGHLIGVRFATGIAGMAVFVAIAGLWGLVFTGFPYAIALRTGNPAAVTAGLLLFFPFAFLTTTFVPADVLTGWMATVADYNPVTYLLAALRSLILEGWDAGDLLRGLAAVLGVGIVSMSLALAALRGRLSPR